MPLMSAVIRPNLAPSAALKSASGVTVKARSQTFPPAAAFAANGGKASPSDAARSSTTTSLALKSIAAAAAVGLCVFAIPNAPAIAIAAAASPSTSVFVGEYADPKHPGCLRAIEGQGSTLDVKGTDGTPGCTNGENQRPWSLTGDVVKTPSETDEILIDFTPKGGPKNLVGKWTGTGILFPDGNEWKKLN